MLFDTHAHLNFEAFQDDYRDIIAQCHEQGISVILPASNLATSRRAVEIAEEYEKGVYAAVGIHPIHVYDEPCPIDEYRALAQHPKVVAIGEVGLDYFHKEIGKSDEERKAKQYAVLQQFLALAHELKLPLILHCREAHDDLIDLLSKSSLRVPGVIHCFGSTWEHAQHYLNMGFLLGMNGIVTYKSFDTALLEKIPLDRMLLETDSPYLTPEPNRKERNTPLNVKIVAQKIAEVKKIAYSEVENVTTENVKRLFNV